MENFEREIDVPKPGVDNKLLLHACCGPCSLEPYQAFHDAGWDITIMYSNSNIYPKSEFEKRFAELEKWCNTKGINFIKDEYDEGEWASRVAKLGESEHGTPERDTRCGECYKLRLEHAAAYALNNGYNHLSSTLAVSPYQLYDLLVEKLEEVCEANGLVPVIADFRPYYRRATARSKNLGMYRQKYCGCKLSFKESWAQFEKSGKTKFLEELKSIAEL